MSAQRIGEGAAAYTCLTFAVSGADGGFAGFDVEEEPKEIWQRLEYLREQTKRPPDRAAS